MSRKSFIITALVINLTICLTMCVVLFTDKDRSDKSNSEDSVINDTKDNETTHPIPTIQDNENSSMNNNVNNSSTEMSGDKTTDNETLKGETTKVIESQVSSETQPVTYNKNQIKDETTGSNINGTTVTINSSCNIRSSGDVKGNVMGVANAGNTYKIDTEKSDDYWIAIILESGQIGYVYVSYCSIQ